MSEQRSVDGVLDTSVVVDLDSIEPSLLPARSAISTITLAELAAGPLATSEPLERARRQDILLRVEAVFAALPFGAAAARSYGRVYAQVAASGRKPRGARAVDLFIAAVACAEGVPLYTRNPDDFAGLEGLVEVVAV